MLKTIGASHNVQHQVPPKPAMKLSSKNFLILPHLLLWQIRHIAGTSFVHARLTPLAPVIASVVVLVLLVPASGVHAQDALPPEKGPGGNDTRTASLCYSESECVPVTVKNHTGKDSKISQSLQHLIPVPGRGDGDLSRSTADAGALGGEKIPVIIRIKSGSEGFALPDGLGIDVVGTSGLGIHADMPASSILRLAQYDEIDRIRMAPAMIEGQAGSPATPPGDGPQLSWDPHHYLLVLLIPAAAATALVWQARRGKKGIAAA